MDAALDTTTAVVNLAPVAQQYGPFFFTLLYTLVVPLLGQSLIKRRIAGAGEISGIELQERVRSQRAYRTFAIAMAAFCLVFSMFWWGYVQLYPPANAIDKLVTDRIKSSVIQGQITGLVPDDILQSYDDVRYTSYVWTDTHSIPIMTRFVVISKGTPIFGEPVKIYYGSQKTIDALSKQNVGYSYQPLSFCLDDSAIDMTVVRASDGQPSLSNERCKPKPPPAKQARS